MRGWIRLGCVVLGTLTCTTRAFAETRHFDDATLRAVHFIDEKEGWVVGDEGVIWHSLDGGESWARQPTGVQASLRSIQFVTPEVGWVAGREELPYGGSAGVLLFTRDGGLKWQRLLGGALPGLNQVRFLNSSSGLLFGDGTDQVPSGVFRTRDSGRSWEPVPGPRATSWYAGDATESGQVILGGAWARLGTLRGDQLRAADEVDRMEARDVLAVQALPQRAIAVARGGLILNSISAGAKWGFADLKLPADIRACLDFNGIHVAGKNVWVVGRPGSAVLHSPDGGQTWRVQQTGSALPLHAVCFFNDQRGWAVGEAGTILATTDGGTAWRIQRQGGKRAAVLIVQARGQDVPLDTLARLGASDGYLIHALQVVSADASSASPDRAVESLRFAAAARLAGGMSGETMWGFALPQYLATASREDVLAFWNRRHGQQAARELMRRLVLTLRIWRPSVVIGDDMKCKIAASALVAEALQEATRQAGDPKIFPEQLEVLGLQPWQPGKVYCLCDRARATTVYDNDDVLAELQTTVVDHATRAASVLPDGPCLVPRERCYQLQQTQDAGNEGAGDLRHGLSAKLGEARREIGLKRVDEEAAQMLREKRKLLLLAHRIGDPSAVRPQLLALASKLPDDHAALALTSVALQYLDRGRWDLARETFDLLTEHYPAQPLSAPAYRWLIQHETSSEVQRRYELKQLERSVEAQERTAAPPGREQKGRGAGSAGMHLGASAVQPASLTEAPTARLGLQTSLDLGKRLAGFGPLFASDPSTQFCLQNARRSLGEVGQAHAWYAKFKDYVPQGPWHNAAEAELWLAGKSPQAPRKVARCRVTDTRPYLDGRFDDPCWQGIKPLKLENAAGDTTGAYPTEAVFAYDQEFLYIAVRCQHPRGKNVARLKARPRDADVDPYDRVSILLDLDRDYTTFFHLQIDQRGCVRDDCCGDITWNPRWYVAVESNEEGWQAEVAIPLGELTSQRISVNSAWAFNIVRVLPGRGVQSWSRPADVRPRPEGMSLLLFQRDPGPTPSHAMPAVP